MTVYLKGCMQTPTQPKDSHLIGSAYFNVLSTLLLTSKSLRQVRSRRPCGSISYCICASIPRFRVRLLLHNFHASYSSFSVQFCVILVQFISPYDYCRLGICRLESPVDDNSSVRCSNFCHCLISVRSSTLSTKGNFHNSRRSCGDYRQVLRLLPMSSLKFPLQAISSC